MTERRFRDRTEAGRLLAGLPLVLVLALPRGGVPVAYEVARALGAPLDVFLVRKLGVPGYEDLAMGAVATGGVRVLNEQVVGGLRIPEHVIEAVAASEQQELARRERLYRGERPPPGVRGRTVILATTVWRPGPPCTPPSTVTAASDWGGPAERKRVRSALPDSYEATFHETRLARFLLTGRDVERVSGAVHDLRLQRAIGVIYRPETERASHYFYAWLPEQFDAVLHFDETRATEVKSAWSASWRAR